MWVFFRISKQYFRQPSQGVALGRDDDDDDGDDIEDKTSNDNATTMIRRKIIFFLFRDENRIV